MLRVLDSAHTADSVLSEMREHREDWRLFLAVDTPTREIKELVERSCFNLVSAAQFVEACKVANWRLSPQLVHLMQQRVQSVLGSQVREDINNMQKNDKCIGKCHSFGQQHFRKPEILFAAAITRGVVDRVHRFSKPEMRTAVVRRWAALEPTSFNCKRSPLSFHTIVTRKQKAGFWSPSPAYCATPAADHSVMRAAASSGQLQTVSCAWLGCWCN